MANMAKDTFADIPWNIPKKGTGRISPAIIGIIVAVAVVCGLVIFRSVGLGSDSMLIASTARNETTQQSGASEGEASDANARTITVHVTGAVNIPGVVQLAEGSRVNDAIAAAEGFSEEADTQVLNLARVVNDGEQIVVPKVGEQTEYQGGGASSSTIAGKLNINAADETELQVLSGIGPSLAARIVAEREANGPFVSTDDIMRVSGIGQKTFARFANEICVG